MSYNPSIPYRGPDGATLSLTRELTAKFGTPSRTYEFVTGWKSPDNVSGHNPDSNGITHGVDIFLTDAQNRWTADHLAARGRAGDKRVAYVIYAGQIASPSTGYQFAGSGWGHWDHPHLSVWDGYWGGPCTLPTTITGDTSSWGIATTTAQGSKPKPIQEDELSKAEVQEIKEHINSMLIHTYTSAGVKNLPGIRPILVENQKRIGALAGKLDAQTELIKQLAKGQGVTIDYDKVEAAAAAGVAKAIADGVDLDATVTIKAGDQ